MYFFICFFIGNVLVALVKLQHSLNNDDAMARLFNHIEGHFQSIGVFAFVVKNIWNKFREKKKKEYMEQIGSHNHMANFREIII